MLKKMLKKMLPHIMKQPFCKYIKKQNRVSLVAFIDFLCLDRKFLTELSLKGYETLIFKFDYK